MATSNPPNTTVPSACWLPAPVGLDPGGPAAAARVARIRSARSRSPLVCGGETPSLSINWHVDSAEKLRRCIAGLTPADWMENIYRGWLWTLEPLWSRNPAP